MAEVVIDEQSLLVLKEFLELYKEDLKRESAERSKQSVIDSEQAEILDKKVLEESERMKTEQAELKAFRESVFEKIEANDENLKKLIEVASDDSNFQETNESTKEFRDDIFTGFWMVILVMIFIACADAFAKSFNKDW